MDGQAGTLRLIGYEIKQNLIGTCLLLFVMGTVGLFLPFLFILFVAGVCYYLYKMDEAEYAIDRQVNSIIMKRAAINFAIVLVDVMIIVGLHKGFDLENEKHFEDNSVMGLVFLVLIGVVIVLSLLSVFISFGRSVMFMAFLIHRGLFARNNE